MSSIVNKPIYKSPLVEENLRSLLCSPHTPLPEFVESIRKLNSKGKKGAAERLKNLLFLVDFTNAKNKQTLSKVSRHTNELVTDTNFASVDRQDDIDFILKKAADKRIVFIINNSVDLILVRKYLPNCTEVIFCCDTPSSLENKSLSRFVIMLGKLAEKSKREPKDLILDFIRETVVFRSHIRLLGFLDWNLLAKLPKFSGGIHIYIPGVTRLEMNHDLIDNFINSTLEKCTKGTTNPRSCLYKILTSFNIFFPDLVSIGFNHSTTREPRTNTIDLSMPRLHTLMKHSVEVRLIFRIHSLIDWVLPRIQDFAGQELLLHPQGALRRKNLNLLSQMTSVNIIGGKYKYVGEFEIDLFPRGTKNTVILNWLITQWNSPTILHAEWKFRSDHLETLAIRPMLVPGTSSFSVRGIYAKNLKKLELINDLRAPVHPRNHGTYAFCSTRKLRNRTTYYHTRKSYRFNEAAPPLEVSDSLQTVEVNKKFPVTFTLQNDFPNCQEIDVVTQGTQWDHYILSISNIREIFPQINLTESFPSYTDDRQRFIVV